MANAFERLMRRLDLEAESESVFVGGSGLRGAPAENRLFGGLVAAQAMMAASRTVDVSMDMHSLHSYFLRPGRPEVPIRFVVDAVKEGKNFHVRSVKALQEGETIFQMLASYSENRFGVEHQDKMISAPEPEWLPNRDQIRGHADWKDGIIDVRICDPLTADTPLPPTKSIWIRPHWPLPEDPLIHLGLLVFASDRAFLTTAWRPHADKGSFGGASLDHSLWLHDRIDFSDWHLYQMHSPILRHQRGLVEGAIYRRDGRRVASVMQEGLLRPA